jgi:hypothetical protein
MPDKEGEVLASLQQAKRLKGNNPKLTKAIESLERILVLRKSAK